MSDYYEAVLPVLQPFTEEVRNILKADDPIKDPAFRLLVYRILQVSPKVIRACQEAGVEADEAKILDTFASLVFQTLCG